MRVLRLLVRIRWMLGIVVRMGWEGWLGGGYMKPPSS